MTCYLVSADMNADAPIRFVGYVPDPSSPSGRMAVFESTDGVVPGWSSWVGDLVSRQEVLDAGFRVPAAEETRMVEAAHDWNNTVLND